MKDWNSVRLCLCEKQRMPTCNQWLLGRIPAKGALSKVLGEPRELMSPVKKDISQQRQGLRNKIR